MKPKMIYDTDPYLMPFKEAIDARHGRIAACRDRFAVDGSLAAGINNHLYYGLHREADGSWVFREWAPNATSMWLVGDFSKWRTDPAFELFRIPGTDTWGREFPPDAIADGDNYRLEMRWDGGRGERIPAYARYVVQDPDTKLYAAKVWQPKRPYRWRHATPARPATPFIYEAHVGMASEDGRVATYAEFRGVGVNGTKLFRGENSTAENGSTIVTLLEDYLQSP